MSDSAILPPKQQPKIVHKLVVRSMIALALFVLLAAAVILIQKVDDLDLPAHAETVGWIAALQYKKDGTQAVLIGPDGSVTPSRGWHSGAIDREPTWRPDGNRVFFASDREDRQVQLFRWNPANNKVERRTQTRGSYAGLSYGVGDKPTGAALVVANGTVLKFDPVVGTTSPMIPPPVKTTGDNSEGGGSIGGMEQIYGDIGTSFKSAVWYGTKKDSILGILKGDRGETLILQDPNVVGGRLRPPMLIAAGDRIDLSMCPANGKVIFTVLNYRFPDPNNIPPQFIQNGRVVVPFRHMAGLLDPAVPGLVNMIASQDNRTCFANPVISPDGSSALLLAGTYSGDGEVDGKVLISIPVREGAASSVARVHVGPVYSPSFSPDGTQIAYEVRGPNGAKSIHVMSSDGSNDRALTPSQDSFGAPAFSPQKKG